MITIIIIILTTYLLSWLIQEWMNAPEGYEDERGFHYGRRK